LAPANLLAEVLNYLNTAFHKEFQSKRDDRTFKSTIFFYSEESGSSTLGELIEKEIKTWGSVAVKMNLTD
jgi:tripartite-type tricarboxylate transporter receptor subunit TctC